jgi:hypothetical protein
MRAVLVRQGWSASEYVATVRELFRTLPLLGSAGTGNDIENVNVKRFSDISWSEAPRFLAWAEEHLAPDLRSLLRIE